MSSQTLVEGPGGVIAAWETAGQVFFAPVTPSLSKAIPAPPQPGGSAPSRKHPVLAVNRAGETLLAWTEGTGWNRGGALAWQVYDASGRPTADRGRAAGGIPTWGLAAAVTRPDGGFTIIH